MKTFGGLEMGIFSRKKKEEDTPVDNSRRKFLQQAGIAMGGLAAGLSVPGLALGGNYDRPVRPGEGPYYSEDSCRRFIERGLPVGMVYCGDPGILDIWALYKSGNQNSMSTARGMAGNGRGMVTGVAFDELSPYMEPAFYVMKTQVGVPANLVPRDEELRNVNPALAHFRSGLGDFYTRWLSNTRSRYDRSSFERGAKNHFMKSILICAGRPASDLEGYDNMTDTQKERFLQGLKIEISGQDYNSHLIAAWSSFMLANTHWYSGDKDFGRKVNELVEIPLRDLYSDDRLGIREHNSKYFTNNGI